MEVKILNDEKDALEIEIESVTLAELFKVYLNMASGVEFAAWRRRHPTENPILSLKTKGKTAKKSLKDAIAKITKDLDNVGSDFKKLK